jgi:hypothetical protein
MQASVPTFDTNSVWLFIMQQVGDKGPTAHVQCAIHFRLMVVSCRHRRADARLLLSPLGGLGKPSSFLPRR